MLWLLDHFLSLIFPLKFFQILRCNFIFSKHRAVFTVSCSTVIWFTYVLYKNSLLTSLIFWSLKYLMTYCTQDHLTADAWVSGPDLAPQNFLLSQKFRHLMNKSEDRGGMKLPYDFLFTFVTINQKTAGLK